MVLRSALLGLLSEKSRSGYDLAKAFRTSLGYSWSAGHSQIYPELARMEEAGLVVSQPAGIRRRRIYSLTEVGRRALEDWLLTEPDRTYRNEASLRLFMLWTLDSARQLAYLDREAAFHLATLKELEEIGRFYEANPIANPYRLMLEWGYRFHRAWLDWIAWAQNEIRAGRGPELGMAGPASQEEPAASAASDRDDG